MPHPFVGQDPSGVRVCGAAAAIAASDYATEGLPHFEIPVLRSIVRIN